MSYDGKEDIAYEEYLYRQQRAYEIFETKLKEAEDPETKQKVKEEYEKECRCADNEFETKVFGRPTSWQGASWMIDSPAALNPGVHAKTI